MPITWREALSIDHGPIDRDHQTLIAIINSFEAVKPGPDAAARLADVLENLRRYGEVHFEREEKLQRQVCFPHAQTHAQQHRHMVRNLAGVRAELALVSTDKDLATFRARMCGFLNDWLLDHLIHNDLLMKPYVKAMAPRSTLIASPRAAEAAAMDWRDSVPKA